MVLGYVPKSGAMDVVANLRGTKLYAAPTGLSDWDRAFYFLSGIIPSINQAAIHRRILRSEVNPLRLANVSFELGSRWINFCRPLFLLHTTPHLFFSTLSLRQDATNLCSRSGSRYPTKCVQASLPLVFVGSLSSHFALFDQFVHRNEPTPFRKPMVSSWNSNIERTPSRQKL